MSSLNKNNMVHQQTLPASNNLTINREDDAVTYEIGKKMFIITPNHCESTDKTVYDALLNLIIKDIENN